MMRNSNREEVYEAFDTELDYQVRKWGPRTPHSFEEWFMYIEDYVNEAKHIMSRESSDVCYAKAKEIMRKVGAMAVQAHVEHGVTKRSYDECPVPKLKDVR